LLGAAAPLPVWAQDAANSVAVGEAVVVGNAATDGENAPDEIIVTAQKQAANIQDVPVSVAAIGGAALENLGIENTSDLALLTPGLAVSSTGPGQTQIIVRGISSTAGSQATSGFYLDEVPVSALSANIEGSLFDLNRVEVLRGPQGTLYGSASMGGAVKYISNQADTDTTEARGDLTLSSTDSGGTNVAANGVVNLPLVVDKAAIRVVGFYKFEDGYIDRFAIDPNNYLAADPTVPPKKNANSYDIWGFRGQMAITPNDTLRITPSAYYQVLKTDGQFVFDEPPGSYRNMIQTRTVPEPMRDEVQIYNLTVVQDLTDDINLTSSTSYFVRDTSLTEDVTKVQFFLEDLYFPGVIPTAYPQQSTGLDLSKIVTQEVRLGGKAGSFDFVVGGYYQRLKLNSSIEHPIPEGFNETFGTPFPDFDILYLDRTRSKTEEIAGFGQATLHASDRLRLTAGVRAFKFDQSFSRTQEGLFNGGSTSTTGKASSDGVTPKFSVDFDVSRDVMLYANVAKGFRAGGALSPVPVSVCAPFLAELGLNAAPTQYDPDSLWSYEVGAKTQLADRRVTLNASAYHIDWSKIQQQVNLQCGFVFTANFGTAVSRGLEFESRWRATDDLTFSVNAGYTDAYLKDTVPGTGSQAGDRLLNVPKYNVSVSTDYEQPVSANLVGFLSGSYSYASKVLAEYDRESQWRTRRGYDIVNVRIGVRDGDDRWRVALFADNLFNTHATVGNLISSTGADIPTTRAISVNRPRTIGINLKAGF